MILDFPKYDKFMYWFILNNSGRVTVIHKQSHGLVMDDIPVETADDQIVSYGASYPTLITDWEDFKKRPEYYVGFVNNKSNIGVDGSKYAYQMTLAGAIMMQLADENKDAIMMQLADENKDPDEIYNAVVEPCLVWLNSTDFYDAPSSAYYHESHASGLVLHSMRVVNQIVQLSKLAQFSGVKLYEAVLVAAVHDWCKIGTYKFKYTKSTGEPVYEVSRDRFTCLGHGASSVYLINQFVHLTYEETLAVQHHMGRWNCSNSETWDLTQANKTYPLVHLLQFADQLSLCTYC